MFEQTFLMGSGKTRRAWTVPAGFALQLVTVGLAVVAPLVFFQVLPQARLAPPPVTAPGPYRPRTEALNSVQVVATQVRTRARNVFVAPIFVPRGLGQPPERTAATIADPGPACSGPCVPDGIETPPSMMRAVLPAVRPPEFRPQVTRPEAKPPVTVLRRSSTVQEAMLINRVTPVFPKLAILTRSAGVVRLAAVIGTDGRIRELQVLAGSHPVFIEATLDAVRQWVYRPTMLNGSPVEVMTDITVTFTLSRN
jgi:periplasmic protein TonB